MKLSIIIPVYNKEKYIEQCMESVLHQSIYNYEIICIDDGSKDNSLKILQRYEKTCNNLKVIIQENRGAAFSRNRGLKEARGEYVQFLDADDFFELNMGYEMYQKAKNKNADIVICYADRYLNSSNNFSERGYFRKPIEGVEVFNSKDVENILDVTSSCVWNKIYRKDFLLDNNIFFQNLPCNNDTAFAVISLILAKRVTYVEKTFVHYRLEENTTNISSERGNKIFCSYEAIKNIIKELKKRKLYSQYKRYISKFAFGVAKYELSFCNNEVLKTKYKKKMSHILSEPEKTKIIHDENIINNVKIIYLFGIIPVLKILNIEKKRKIYLFCRIYVGSLICH